jgi:hypothetical protein
VFPAWGQTDSTGVPADQKVKKNEEVTILSTNMKKISQINICYLSSLVAELLTLFRIFYKIKVTR